MKLQDRTAIITGGAGGIGSGMALAMAKEGAKVVIIDVNEELGNAMEQELQAISSESFFIKADLTDHANLKSIVETVVEKNGKLDILVNNAHVSRQTMFADIPAEELELSLNTGFYPTWYLMQAAYPYLKETKGNVINFASGA